MRNIIVSWFKLVDCCGTTIRELLKMILQVKINMEKGTNQLIKLGKMSHHNLLIRRNYWEKE